MRHKWLKFLLAFVAVYAVLSAVLAVEMRRKPGEFNQFMAKLPKPLMYVLPFQPLWYWARGGKIEVGAAAPDFQLPVLHREEHIRLSSFRDQRPVVLVFGSYT